LAGDGETEEVVHIPDSMGEEGKLQVKRQR
jgi:hypothetical protein